MPGILARAPTKRMATRTVPDRSDHRPFIAPSHSQDEHRSHRRRGCPLSPRSNTGPSLCYWWSPGSSKPSMSTGCGRRRKCTPRQRNRLRRWRQSCFRLVSSTRSHLVSAFRGRRLPRCPVIAPPPGIRRRASGTLARVGKAENSPTRAGLVTCTPHAAAFRVRRHPRCPGRGRTVRRCSQTSRSEARR